MGSGDVYKRQVLFCPLQGRGGGKSCRVYRMARLLMQAVFEDETGGWSLKLTVSVNIPSDVYAVLHCAGEF